MREIRERTVESHGLRMHVLEAGEGDPVLLCHGFPDVAWGWRHQIRALADAGYRVIAPDQRGYADSDAPEAVEAYTIHHLAGDLTGLLDTLRIEQAVFVGHDWGGDVVWKTALLAPHRVKAVVGVNTPYFPRSPAPPVSIMRRRAEAEGKFHYMVYFQEPGVAEAELERDVERTLRGFFQPPPDHEAMREAKKSRRGELAGSGGGLLDRMPDAPVGDFLDPEDFEVYLRKFRKSGFRGPLNWYRNLDRNWELTAYLDGAKIRQPALMITAERDLFLPPAAAEGMERWVPNLETVEIQGSGHWTPQEKPNEVNGQLLRFLAEIRA